MTPKSALMASLAQAAGRRRQIPLPSGQRAPVGRDPHYSGLPAHPGREANTAATQAQNSKE